MQSHRTTRLAPAPLALTFGALVLGVAIAAGCGSKPEAKAPVTETKSDAAATTSSAPAGAASDAKSIDNSPTASNVNIDDQILKACGITAPEAHFAFDSSTIRPEDATPLDKVAACFSNGPLKGRTLKLVGHADARGDADYNFGLAQQRADSIAGYLVTKGLDKGHETTTSRGAMDAVAVDAPGTSDAAFAKDRRVDLLLAAP